MSKSLSVAAVLLLTACRSETEFGKCVGAFDQKRMNPALEYEVSTRNIVWAVLGFEFIAPPIIVALKETHCPVGRKDPTP